MTSFSGKSIRVYGGHSFQQESRGDLVEKGCTKQALVEVSGEAGCEDTGVKSIERYSMLCELGTEETSV